MENVPIFRIGRVRLPLRTAAPSLVSVLPEEEEDRATGGEGVGQLLVGGSHEQELGLDDRGSTVCLKLLVQAQVRKVLGSIGEPGRKGLGYWFLPQELMRKGTAWASLYDTYSV